MSRDATPLDVIEGRARWCVVCADNRDVLPTLPKVDVVVTDPPYGLGSLAPRGGLTAGTLSPKNISVSWDVYDDQWMRLIGSTPAAVFCDQSTVFSTASALGADRLLVYAKSNPSPFGSSYEPCVTRGIKKPTQWQHIVSYNSEGSASGHPTEKPVEVMLWVVGLTDGVIILDPFCGSGTTGVACLRLGRRFIGIEKDANYAEVARERLEAESRGLTLRDARAGQLSLLENLDSEKAP